MNREIYKDWFLDSLYDLKFHEWYSNEKNFNLFSDEYFKVTGRPKYEVLVRRFNVFIDYHNRMSNFRYNQGEMIIQYEKL